MNLPKQFFAPPILADADQIRFRALAAEGRRRYFYSMPSVAVIGASNDRSKWGNKSVRAFQQRGYKVYPVNPTETEVEGLKAFKTISEVPARPDKVTVYVRPKVLLKILPDIAAKGCDEVWLNPGTESDEVLTEADRLKLNVVQGCSIIGVGVSPASL